MNHTEESKTFGIECAKMFYKLYHNKDMQTLGFTWKQFPKRAASQAASLLVTNFDFHTKNIENLKKIAYNACYNEAVKLMQG